MKASEIESGAGFSAMMHLPSFMALGKSVTWRESTLKISDAGSSWTLITRR